MRYATFRKRSFAAVLTEKIKCVCFTFRNISSCFLLCSYTRVMDILERCSQVVYALLQHAPKIEKIIYA